jgi:predicted nucleotidyltransferase
MDEVRSALAKLRQMSDDELDRVCRDHQVRVLTVFGSAIDDERPRPADLDLGVVFEPGSSHDVLGLLEALVSRLGTERIDILDAGRASETARMRAIGEGEPLYESEPTAFAMAASAAQALYWETAPMRRAALTSLDP